MHTSQYIEGVLALANVRLDASRKSRFDLPWIPSISARPTRETRLAKEENTEVIPLLPTVELAEVA